jgi:hypothetical protein
MPECSVVRGQHEGRPGSLFTQMHKLNVEPEVSDQYTRYRTLLAGKAEATRWILGPKGYQIRWYDANGMSRKQTIVGLIGAKPKANGKP